MDEPTQVIDVRCQTTGSVLEATKLTTQNAVGGTQMAARAHEAAVQAGEALDLRLQHFLTHIHTPFRRDVPDPAVHSES
jgi:hypothetical protein